MNVLSRRQLLTELTGHLPGQSQIGAARLGRCTHGALWRLDLLTANEWAVLAGPGRIRTDRPPAPAWAVAVPALTENWLFTWLAPAAKAASMASAT